MLRLTMQADCADKTAGRLEPPRVRPAVAMVPPPLRRHTRHSAGHSIATDPTLKQLTSHGVTLSPTPAAAEWRSEARRLKPPRAPFWLSQAPWSPTRHAGCSTFCLDRVARTHGRFTRGHEPSPADQGRCSVWRIHRHGGVATRLLVNSAALKAILGPT